jgi:excisionase family DNA binding protein
MATLEEAAQQLHVSKATLRRWIKAGAIDAYLDKTGPHGPQWHIPEGIIARRLHPDQTVITVLPPEERHPMQMITEIKETVITVEGTVTQLMQAQEQVTHTITEMHHELLTELRALQQQIVQLQEFQRRRWWWPWTR